MARSHSNAKRFSSPLLLTTSPWPLKGSYTRVHYSFCLKAIVFTSKIGKTEEDYSYIYLDVI